MSWYEVGFTDELYGEIAIQGSKNTVLPVLAATLLAKDVTVIEGCPDISDVHNTVGILRELGCVVNIRRGIMGLIIEVDSSYINNCQVSECNFAKMRSSIIFLGALLSSIGYAKIGYPGGCVIGKRPVDMHIKALRELGAEINECDTYIEGNVNRFKGTEVEFGLKSVGATENAIMAAVMAEGITVIKGCAKEPEIVELCRFLRCMGANIEGDGTDIIVIRGVHKLHGCNFEIAGDRIVAATYIAAVGICGGDVFMKNINPRYLGSTINLFNKAGVEINVFEDCIEVFSKKGTIKALGEMTTGPYPGIPTDIQPAIMALMCYSKGTTIINETIFENRFMCAGELVKMGADIENKNENRAIINGKGFLNEAVVYGKDLRGTTALIIAALGSFGVTRVYGKEFVIRGHEDIVSDLRHIGGRIELIDEEKKINYNFDFNSFSGCTDLDFGV